MQTRREYELAVAKRDARCELQQLAQAYADYGLGGLPLGAEVALAMATSPDPADFDAVYVEEQVSRCWQRVMPHTATEREWMRYADAE